MPINDTSWATRIHADAEKQTQKHLRRAIEDAEEKNIHIDLTLVPVMQATTPNDEAHKNANTGMNGVHGSPDEQPDSYNASNGIADPKLTDSKDSKK